MTAAELSRLASELGLDVVGAAPAEPYEETERHIRERRARGLFARHALHDGEARGLVSSGAPVRRSAYGRLGCDLLLRAVAASRPGRGAPAPLHVAGRLRRAPHAARGARDAAGRTLSRARGRERPCRSGGCDSLGSRLLRQEHDGDQPVVRVLDRARDARHRRRDRDNAPARAGLRFLPALRGRVPDRGARRARRARRDALPLVLDSGARADPAGVPTRARRHGVRLRRVSGRVPVEPRHRAAPERREPASRVDTDGPSSRVARRGRPGARQPSSTGSTFRATTRAGFAGTLSSPPGTSGRQS